MKLFNQFTYWHNRASDTAFVWFPFNFLKPKSNSPIGLVLKSKMIICFGIYYGVFAGLRNVIFSRAELVPEILECIGWSVLIFTLWFNLVTAPLWNSRAKREME